MFSWEVGALILGKHLAGLHAVAVHAALAVVAYPAWVVEVVEAGPYLVAVVAHGQHLEEEVAHDRHLEGEVVVAAAEEEAPGREALDHAGLVLEVVAYEAFAHVAEAVPSVVEVVDQAVQGFSEVVAFPDLLQKADLLVLDETLQPVQLSKSEDPHTLRDQFLV
jgi:hypothetical protein